jgi:hypothetical protein
MYGIEVWGLSKAWKEVDTVYNKFCKKLIDNLYKTVQQVHMRR